MTVLVIADDEGLVRRMPVASAEVLISCGDLYGQTILRAADRCGARHILAVKGNHDSGAPFPEPIVDLRVRTHTIHSVVFGGFGGSWKYKPRGHHLFEQREVDEALAELPRVDVFVAHNFPRLVHDREDEVHFGFGALIRDSVIPELE